MLSKYQTFMKGLYEKKINFEKSKLFLWNSGRIVQQRVENIFHCAIGEFPIAYLSMSLFKGGINEALWDLVIEHFSKKLVGWKGFLFIQEGKF